MYVILCYKCHLNEAIYRWFNKHFLLNNNVQRWESMWTIKYDIQSNLIAIYNWYNYQKWINTNPRIWNCRRWIKSNQSKYNPYNGKVEDWSGWKLSENSQKFHRLEEKWWHRLTRWWPCALFRWFNFIGDPKTILD